MEIYSGNDAENWNEDDDRNDENDEDQNENDDGSDEVDDFSKSAVLNDVDYAAHQGQCFQQLQGWTLIGGGC